MNQPLQAGDDEVIDSVLDGDREAFSILVKRYQNRIIRLGYGFFHNADEAEDFAQDVFVKAYVALASFRRKSSFSTWLTRIAYNSGINGKRKSGRYEPLDYDPVDTQYRTPEEEHIRKETTCAIQKAMANLPEKYAICLDLYFREGMKYEEISETTGFPVNTIKSHVFRARKELRIALGDEYPEN